MIAFAYAVIVGGLAFGAVLVITMLAGCVQPSAKADLGINASVELTRPCR